MDFSHIDIGMIAMQYVCLLFSLCLHEAAHAAMANYCGDPTARMLGRLTLDPTKHADIFGTVVFPLIAMTSGVPLLGWAKPVPVNPRNLRNYRRDQVLVALAGPGSNVLLALAAVFILRIVFVFAQATGSSAGLEPVAEFLLLLILMNIGLALFNIIPVPPLDGHYLLRYFISPRAAQVLDQMGPLGIVLVFILGRHWLAFALPPVFGVFRWLITYGM